MEVNRIESLKKMEEYVREMLAGTKCSPSLEKIEKFVSACERTNYSMASSLDSSVNLSLSPDKTFSHANSAMKKKRDKEEEKGEEEKREKQEHLPQSETPRSSHGTEHMEPDFFGNEEEEEEDDLEYQPGTASSLRSSSVSESNKEEDEIEEGTELFNKILAMNK